VILDILERLEALVSNQKNVTFFWVPSHFGIKGNENADAAAKAALQIPISPEERIPYTDLKSFIRTYFLRIWQDRWNQTPFNKLQLIKPKLGETKMGNVTSRREEVSLHRARIGHTYLTHSYLLKHEPCPDCSFCMCPLTVQHILVDCMAYANVRSKYFNVTSLHELFNEMRFNPDILLVI
jgi:hypothetical protein